MLYFKACPRCKGDMRRDRDVYGEFMQCLQCGNMVDVMKSAGQVLSAATAGVPAEKEKVA